MKILCVIPARGGSKRLPGKNIMKILGRPLIAYPISQAIESGVFDRIVVSTDDDAIAGVASGAGAAVIRRPPELATDAAAIEDAIRHVVRELEKNENYRPDVVTLLQANVVYRRPGLIKETVRKLAENGRYDSVITVYQVNQRPEWMKRVEGDLLIPNMNCDRYRQQELPALYLADGAVAAIRTDVLMGTEGLRGVHRFLGAKIGCVVQDRLFSAEVDEPDDVLTAELLLELIRRKEGRE
ncbi:MAG: acylneuraminate cytidylyltransferase family protein [bacterium]